MERIIYKEKIIEPDWNVLVNFGLPVNVPEEEKKNYSYNIVKRNFKQAAEFLQKNRQEEKYLRYYDAYKAMLLALKIHYPGEFQKIENQYLIDFSKLFNLKKIEGKHIKLRNISLNILSKYYNKF